jgi:hypothetical protein
MKLLTGLLQDVVESRNVPGDGSSPPGQRQNDWKLFMADATKVEVDSMASWHKASTGEQLQELLYN